MDVSVACRLYVYGEGTELCKLGCGPGGSLTPGPISDPELA